MTENFVLGARSAHDLLMTSAGAAACLAAAALLHPAARARCAALMAAVDAAPPERVRRAVLWGSTALAAWLCLLKALAHGAFQSHMDTAILVNAAANVLDGRGLACTVDGTPSVLTVHFAFFVPLFLAPLLLLWKGTLPFLFVQTAALASMGPAAFALARRRTGSAALGLAVMSLVYSHPSFHQLLFATLENAVFGPPLLLWGLVLWERGRRLPAAALWTLALTTREQFPFTLAGLGVYTAFRDGLPDRRRALEGAAIISASATLWILEMRIVGSYSDALNTAYWGHYGHFGGSKEEAIRTVLTRPHLALARAFWPPSHLAPLARLVAEMGLFPAADPAGLAALVVSAAHHLLQNAYFFSGQTASYTFGPAVFAAVLGAAALAKRKAFAGAGAAWLLLPALSASGYGLLTSERVIHPRWGLHFMGAAPELLRLIPDGASAWSEDYVGSWLGARPQLKMFIFTGLHVRFDRMLFRPEYVLVDGSTLLLMAPADRARLLGFLARERYAKVAESGSLYLLKDPLAPHGGRSPELVLKEEPGDTARAAEFLAAVFDSPRARSELAAYPPDLRYRPGSAEQHASFSRILMGRGLVPLAVEHGRAAVALWPEFAQAHNNLGNALAAAGDHAGAERHLKTALDLAPQMHYAAYNLGNVLIGAGRPGEAVPLLERAARSVHDDGRILNSLGAAYLLERRPVEAAAAFEAALRVDPGLADARENLAQARRVLQAR